MHAFSNTVDFYCLLENDSNDASQDGHCKCFLSLVVINIETLEADSLKKKKNLLTILPAKSGEREITVL